MRQKMSGDPLVLFVPRTPKDKQRGSAFRPLLRVRPAHLALVEFRLAHFLDKTGLLSIRNFAPPLYYVRLIEDSFRTAFSVALMIGQSPLSSCRQRTFILKE